MLQFMVALVKDLIDGKELAKTNFKEVICGTGILEKLMFDFQYENGNWKMTWSIALCLMFKRWRRLLPKLSVNVNSMSE